MNASHIKWIMNGYFASTKIFDPHISFTIDRARANNMYRHRIHSCMCEHVCGTQHFNQSQSNGNSCLNNIHVTGIQSPSTYLFFGHLLMRFFSGSITTIKEVLKHIVAIEWPSLR